MRILFISHYDNLYGANRALLTLLLGIKKEGKHEPFLVIPAEGEMTRKVSEAGIEYFICSITQWQAIYRESISFELKKRKRVKQIGAEVDKLYRHFKDKKIDLIHSNSSVIGTGAMLAEKLGCRHVWHIREFTKEHYGMRYFYPRDVVDGYYKKADKLILISDALKEYYDKLYPEAETIRIYDGVDPAEALSAASKPPLSGSGQDSSEDAQTKSPRAVSFVYTGYLFPKKRQMDVLKAALMLKKEGVGGFKVILAGSGDTSYQKKLKRFIAANDLSEAEMPGFVEDVPGLLKKCDIGIIASEYEGFGLVTVEYMLNRMPVVGRRSGATPELIKNGVTGLLYDDIDGLKEAMKKLINEAGLRTEMGEEGYKRAGECFTVDKNIKAISELFDEMDEG